MSSLEKLKELANLSGNIQSATNFVISFIFLVIFFKYFHGTLSGWKANTLRGGTIRTSTIRDQTQSKINPLIVRVSMLYVTVYTLRYLLFVILWAIEDIKISYLWKEEIFEYIFDFAFVVASFLFNLLMTLRLHTAFKGSIFQPKKHIFIILYSLLIISSIINELYFVIRHNAKKEGHIFYHKEEIYKYGIHTYLFLVLVVLNLFIGGLLIYHFNKSVLTMVRLKEEYNTKLNIYKANNAATTRTRRNTIETLNASMKARSRMLLQVGIKYTILCSVAIIVSNVQFCGWIILQFNGIRAYESTLWFDMIWSWLFNVVLFINFSCILLSFSFSVRCYKILCQRSADGCEDCCLCIVGSQMYKQQTMRDEAVNKEEKVVEENNEDPACLNMSEQIRLTTSPISEKGEYNSTDSDDSEVP